MPEKINPSPEVSYSTTLRQTDPQKMQELEGQVREFWNAAKLDTDPPLSDKAIAHVANLVANRLRRKLAEGATPEEIDKAIEDALYEGVDIRLKMKKEGFEE